jgi:hypothetical protein
LGVADNAAGSPQKTALSGTGTTAKLSPVSLGFSTRAIGTTSATKKITLTNVGTTTLVVTSIVITGPNAGDFAQTHTCGSSLAAGASCSISVVFKPTGSGTRTAAVSVTDNAAGSPQKASLRGFGTTGEAFSHQPGFRECDCWQYESAAGCDLEQRGHDHLQYQRHYDWRGQCWGFCSNPHVWKFIGSGGELQHQYQLQADGHWNASRSIDRHRWGRRQSTKREIIGDRAHHPHPPTIIVSSPVGC